MTYQQFLEARRFTAGGYGLTPNSLPAQLFGWQRDLVAWALHLGSAALFCDCGLGKGPMALAWAAEVVRATNLPVLVLTPLAVGPQMLREADKFHVEAVPHRIWKGQPTIVVLNYEQLHHVDVSKFAGLVCDESSILKNFDGVRRAAITDAMKRVRYRLLCTATAAPNDYTELGTSSEALGYLGYQDMLSRFFVNDQHSNHPNRLITGAAWRFRGHAQEPFWRWVASWARAMRHPSDLGYPDDGFVLPLKRETVHIVEARTTLPGQLFARPAVDMREERAERRATLRERCDRAATLADHGEPVVIWCHLNDEGTYLSGAIPGSVEVSGALDEDEKESRLTRFTDGDARVLIVKPKIGAWGLNWQHCAHVITFGSHSYEQYYQSVRRCWRYGQTRPVRVDLVVSEGEARVLQNLQRKAAAADEMFAALVTHMRAAQEIRRSEVGNSVEVPEWLVAVS